MKYSQNDEEKFILQACLGGSHAEDKGRFLDLGAFHPTVFSNVRALYEKGWSGVLVEASPGPFLSLLKAYGEDQQITLINGAIGLTSGFAKMYATDDAVSTTSEEVHKVWEKDGGYYGSFLTPQIEIERLLNRFGRDFDFINIDIEGNSAAVFLRILELGARPRCFCVEHDGKSGQLDAAAVAAQYDRTHFTGENCVYKLR